MVLRGVRHIRLLLLKQNDMRFDDAKKKGQLIFISLVILHRRLVLTLTDQPCCRNEPFKIVQRKTTENGSEF